MNTIPKELTSLRQWVCWRRVDRDDGRVDKIPHNPHNGKKASSTNPASWGSYAEAVAGMEKYLCAGIGFVFTKEDGFIGVDIDHCRNAETGALSKAAQAILEHAATYTEVSPSGEGLHLFIRGNLPAGGNRNTRTGVEMYEHSRYFTMTGKQLPDTPDMILQDDAALAWIHGNFIKPPKTAPQGKKKQKASVAPLSDEDVLAKASEADQDGGFAALWEGKWQETYPSQSEADIALCNRLAYWTRKDATQIDRLFRHSGLMRDKWDVKHHASGATYGAETISRAIEATVHVYGGSEESPIFEYAGRYFRAKGEKVYPITNFTILPLEMIESEDESQMTADLVTVRGEVFRQSFLTTDFANLQRFKNVINKRTISLSYTGSEAELELLKAYVSSLDWVRKRGVKAIGTYFHDNRWVYVGDNHAVAARGETVSDIVQMEKYRGITSDILDRQPIAAERLRDISNLLLEYNEPAKTVPILAWCAGCFLKEHFKMARIKFPHLFMIGEQGSGKSNTLEQIIMPIFSKTKIQTATQMTGFSLMKEASTSNLIPQVLEEFKPSKIRHNALAALYNHMRDSYDGHLGMRGKMDQSVVTYELSAPLIVLGEESPDEAAIRERSIELLFSRKHLKPLECRHAFYKLCEKSSVLADFGRGLLDTALKVTASDVKKWHEQDLERFDKELPPRILNNLGCAVTGLRLLEILCDPLPWEDVFQISFAACCKYLAYATREYLLDGDVINKGIIENSLEIMARMGLDPQEEFTMLEDEKHIAIRFSKVYDRFTKYRRDHAITGECLEQRQFLKQLRNSDFYVDFRSTRIGGIVRKAHVLNYEAIQKRCDIDDFTGGTAIEPL